MAKGDVLVRMKADVSGYDANIAKARRQLENFKKDNLSLGGVLKQTQGALLATAARFASVTAAVGALGSAFMDNIATARKFEVSMSQLSSLTGMVGADLAKLKEYAIELGSSTTLSASQVADAFKMIGSQQPQLLASGEALKSVTKNAITLAEAAGIDLATAAQTLSTSINQMGGDSGNAERYINVLAAASQKGAGDIAWLGEAITKSGTTAKAVGTDYEELVANLEQLAKAGFDASTAGTALRSIIMNLEKQANNDFKPSVVGLTQAFENLGNANLSIVGYQEIAGKMFASQAKALADAAGEARDMTSAITGTNTAEEQAKTNTDNLEGSIKALSSAWEGFNLHLNSSNGIFRDIVDGLKDVVVWADNVITKLGEIPNPENIITKNLKEVGPNVDDNGNYIKRPAQKGAVGFDWENGTWMKGYTGAIYNGATGQTELPEVEVVGNKITKGGGKTKKGGGKTETVKTEEQLNNDEIQKLTQEYIKASDDRRKAIEGEINTLQDRNAEIKRLMEAAQGKVAPEGSLKALSEELSKLQQERQLLSDPIDIELHDQAIKDVQDEIDRLNGKNVEVELVVDSRTPFEKLKDSLKIEIAEENMQVDTTTLQTLMKTAIQNGIDGLYPNFSALQEKMREGMNIPDSAWEDLQTQINEKLKELDIEPIKIDFKTGNLAKDGKETEKSWNAAAQAVQSVGGAMQSIEDPAAKVAGTIAQAIASIALGYAQATTQAATLGPWAWVAFAATGMAQMISMISGIHNATGYAEGGIIKGNSYSGDNIMANGGAIGLNAGELVLSKAQQSTLASELQNGGNRIQVVGRLSGEQLFLCAENWAKRTGKGEFVTW